VLPPWDINIECNLRFWQREKRLLDEEEARKRDVATAAIAAEAAAAAAAVTAAAECDLGSEGDCNGFEGDEGDEGEFEYSDEYDSEGDCSDSVTLNDGSPVLTAPPA
jgi:hypothetical protein